jgi:hypothetical protein
MKNLSDMARLKTFLSLLAGHAAAQAAPAWATARLKIT